MKYSNIDFTNDVKVLGRVVSIAMDNKVAEAEQVFDTPFVYDDESKKGWDQYSINRLFRDKIWLMDQAGLIPEDQNAAITFTNPVNFDGATTFNGNAKFKGQLVANTINVINTISANKGEFDKAEIKSTDDDALTVHGGIVTNELLVKGIIHAIGGLTVDGKAIFNNGVEITAGGIEVTGDSVFHDNVKFEKNITVDGRATFNGDVIVKNTDISEWEDRIRHLEECCEEVRELIANFKCAVTLNLTGVTANKSNNFEVPIGGSDSVTFSLANGYTEPMTISWSPSTTKSTISKSGNTVTINNASNEKITITATATKYVEPEPTTYTLTYKDGDETLDTQSYAAGATISPITSPTKDGYMFNGWSGMPSNMKMPSNNLTVYAEWVEESEGGEDRVFNILASVWTGEAPDGVPFIGPDSNPINEYITSGKLHDGSWDPDVTIEYSRNDGYNGTTPGTFYDCTPSKTTGNDASSHGFYVPDNEDGSPVEFKFKITPGEGTVFARATGTAIRGEFWNSSNYDSSTGILTVNVYYSDLIENGGSSITLMFIKEESGILDGSTDYCYADILGDVYRKNIETTPGTFLTNDPNVSILVDNDFVSIVPIEEYGSVSNYYKVDEWTSKLDEYRALGRPVSYNDTDGQNRSCTITLHAQDGSEKYVHVTQSGYYGLTGESVKVGSEYTLGSEPNVYYDEYNYHGDSRQYHAFFKETTWYGPEDSTITPVDDYGQVVESSTLEFYGIVHPYSSSYPDAIFSADRRYTEAPSGFVEKASRTEIYNQ